MAWKEDVNSPLILTIGAISGFLVIVVAIGIQAWYLSEEQTEIELKSAAAVNYQLVDLNTRQQTNINTYRWIDQSRQTAAIPIDQAMNLLIQNNGKLPTTQPR